MGLGAGGVAADAVGKLGFGISACCWSPMGGLALGVEHAEASGLGFEGACIPSRCFSETIASTGFGTGVALAV